MTAAINRALELHQPPAGWEPTTGMKSNQSAEEAAAAARLVLFRSSILSDDWPYMVRAFRTLMDLPLPPAPRELRPLEKQLHASLISEEAHEFAKADGVIEQVDGLIDIIYVALGALLHMGLSNNQILAAFAEVQASNMTKVMDNGQPLINDGEIDPTQPVGKVLKTSNYVKPNIAEAINYTKD